MTYKQTNKILICIEALSLKVQCMAIQKWATVIKLEMVRFEQGKQRMGATKNLHYSVYYL